MLTKKFLRKYKPKRALFIVDKLKHKVGPIVAGSFTLDSKKPGWNVDVFWNKDHSTRLWVYVERFDRTACILIQPPIKLAFPIMTPGPYHDIDIAQLLTVEPGSTTPSGLPASLFKPNKGMLDDVHKLTFTLGTKDSTGTNGNLRGAETPVLLN